MSWIHHNTQLHGNTVVLLPMENAHFAELCALANDKRIWEFIPVDMSDPEACMRSFSTALTEREKESRFPFVIVHKTQHKIIGSTSLMDLQPAHKKLEIGWTWLQPEYWATTVNLECKLALLSFCFEELHANRVQLKTDETNLRSRKAIEKIGGHYEGTLRQDMLRDNGTIRSSAYFSLLAAEWHEKKQKLEQRIQIR